MDGYEIILNIKMMLNILTFVVMPMCVTVLSVFAVEIAKVIKSNKNSTLEVKNI